MRGPCVRSGGRSEGRSAQTQPEKVCADRGARRRSRHRRLVRPVLVDHRPLPRVDRRRLCRRAQRDARRQGVGLRRGRRGRRQRPGPRRRRDRHASTTATTASRCRRRADQDRHASRRPSTASASRSTAQAGRRRSGQGAARLGASAGATRADLELEAPAGSSPPRQYPQPPDARAGAGQPRSGASPPCRRAQAAVEAGDDQCRRAEGAAGGGGAHARSNCRRRSPRPSATSRSRSSARPFDGVIGNRAMQSRRLRAAGPAARQPGAARRRLYRRQLQGDAARRPASGPAGVDLGRRAAGPHASQGTVGSIAPASGSVFSLLPPDNATGNFTKIVQRLPVRIRGAGRRSPSRSCCGRACRWSSASTPSRRAERSCGRRGARPHRARLRRLSQAERAHVMARSPVSDSSGRRQCRARASRSHRAAPAVRLPHHGVRHVHGDPGHPDRLGLARPRSRPGLPRSATRSPGCRPSYLIAEVVMIPLSGFLSRALGTRIAVRHLGRRLHGGEPDVRALDLDQRDDRLARRSRASSAAA